MYLLIAYTVLKLTYKSENEIGNGYTVMQAQCLKGIDICPAKLLLRVVQRCKKEISIICPLEATTPANKRMRVTIFRQIFNRSICGTLLGWKCAHGRSESAPVLKPVTCPRDLGEAIFDRPPQPILRHTS